MSKKLGDILEAARAHKGDTLRDVEKATKISNAYLSQLESGGIKEPSPHKLHKLASHFNLNYNDLMAAAGYIAEGKRPSSTSAMLLASENLTDSEAAAVAAFIKQLREFSENRKK
jgi:HTH-type transcriptional regulator, competence development regulator